MYHKTQVHSLFCLNTCTFFTLILFLLGDTSAITIVSFLRNLLESEGRRPCLPNYLKRMSCLRQLVYYYTMDYFPTAIHTLFRSYLILEAHFLVVNITNYCEKY